LHFCLHVLVLFGRSSGLNSSRTGRATTLTIARPIKIQTLPTQALPALSCQHFAGIIRCRRRFLPSPRPAPPTSNAHMKTFLRRKIGDRTARSERSASTWRGFTSESATHMTIPALNSSAERYSTQLTAHHRRPRAYAESNQERCHLANDFRKNVFGEINKIQHYRVHGLPSTLETALNNAERSDVCAVFNS